MTFSSLEKLIREETRKVVENLERSFSLYEDDEKPASENPDKMLVVNKESGKSYYINKDSFDPSKHQTSSSKTPGLSCGGRGLCSVAAGVSRHCCGPADLEALLAAIAAGAAGRQAALRAGSR